MPSTSCLRGFPERLDGTKERLTVAGQLGFSYSRDLKQREGIC